MYKRDNITVENQMQGLAGVSPLPCLNSNNSTAEGKTSDGLTSHQRKAIRTGEDNIARFIEVHGASHCLFTTLTFPDHVTDMKEAQSRFNSLATHFLRDFSPHYISVKERCKSGRIHFHLLLAVDQDIQTGFDHSAVFSAEHLPRKVRYSSASPYLKSVWALFRKTLPGFGFGRAELAPIRTNSVGLSKYLTKYLTKGYTDKLPEYPDKGIRLINYSSRWLRNSCKFSWNTEGAKEWRRKVGLFARILLCSDLDELSQKLGSQWAYKYKDFILAVDQFEGARVFTLLDKLAFLSAAGETPPEGDEGERAQSRPCSYGKAYERAPEDKQEWAGVYHRNSAGEWFVGPRPSITREDLWLWEREQKRENTRAGGCVSSDLGFSTGNAADKPQTTSGPWLFEPQRGACFA